MTLSALAVRLIQLSFNPLEYLDGKDNKKEHEDYWIVRRAETKDKGQYYPLGGVTFIEILDIPPSTVSSGKWTIRQITSLATECVRLDYASLDQANATTPMKVSFVIPRTVIIRDEFPRIGWWNKV